MPVYEYFCRTCGTRFEKLRPISAVNEPAACPSGHDGALRTLSLVAAVGRSGGSDEPLSWGGSGGGGCACGGACSCAG